MGKEFFNGWALWQKMTFVLACGIVATIFAGLCKVQFDRYRLRKYTAVEKGKQKQNAEMLEAQPISEEPQGDEVPFGIRALESGIEVDGVWISRSNTPVGSSRSSIADSKLPPSYSSSQLELPKAIHASSSRSSLTASFDRAVSAERVITNDSRASSPGRPPMASSSRFSNFNFQRNTSTLQALEGYDAASSTAPRNGQNSSSNSGKSSARTSDESDYLTLPEQPYDSNPKLASSLSVPADPRTDLNLLQSHRLSHVAETGQLTPRVRKPGSSGDWASGGMENLRTPQEISTSNGVDFFVPRQKTPSPPLAPLTNPPKDEFAPSGSRIPQDNQFSHQATQIAPPETYVPQPSQAYQAPQTYQPRGPQREPEEASYQEVQTAQNGERQSQVLRKVNSGFEILRPGTLGEPTSPEEDDTAAEKRKPNRLQKRRKSSSASRPSHFVEEV